MGGQQSTISETEPGYLDSLKSIQANNDALTLQLRDLRDLHTSDLEKFQARESELLSALSELTTEFHRNQMEIRQLNTELNSKNLEMQSLTEKLNGLQMEVDVTKQRLSNFEDEAKKMEEHLKNALDEEIKNRANAVQAEAERTKMANSTIERLKDELDMIKVEKQKLNEALSSFDQTHLLASVKNHELNENISSVMSCLEAAKQRIELLEVNLGNKEEHASRLSHQIDDLTKMLDTEKDMRMKTDERSKELCKQNEKNELEAAHLEKCNEIMEEIRKLQMDAVVDSAILNSFLQFSNFLASKSQRETITSLKDLWKKHGSLLSSLVKCDVTEFDSSAMFYDVLCRKLRHTNSAMSDDLNVLKAADGDPMEICKFFALVIEHMRKEDNLILKHILEQCSAHNVFNIESILHMFSHFDKLYENETVDDWWSILKSDDEPIFVSATPTSTRRTNLHRDMFTTPTNSARRIRSVCNTARRSPVVDAVDSPTMKFLRAEREAKRARKELADTEIKLDDAIAENSSLVSENMQLKKTIEDLRSSIAGERSDVARNEQRVEDLENRLKLKTAEAEKLTTSLDGARQNIKSLMSQLESAENEASQFADSLKSLQTDKDALLLQLRDLRDLHTSDLEKFQARESELLSALSELTTEFHRNQMEIRQLNTELNSKNLEMQSLTEKLNGLQMEVDVTKQRLSNFEDEAKKMEEHLKNALDEEIKNRANAVQAEAERTKMANSTIERLKDELDMIKVEKQKLNEALSSFDQTHLLASVKNHELNENISSVMSCLEAAKQRIELLEVNLGNKEEHASRLSHQIDDLTKMLDTEKDMRMKTDERSKELCKQNEKNELEAAHLEKCNEIMEEIRKLQETVKTLETDNKKLLERKEQLSNDLENEQRLVGNLNRLIGTHLNGNNNEMITTFDMAANYESLIDKELEMHESPKKVVTFGEYQVSKRESMPPGLKISCGSSSKRDSLASDTISRNSILRSSSRFDYSTDAFKTPMKPKPGEKIDFGKFNMIPETPGSEKKKNNRRKSIMKMFR
ncbi:unnamed protein product [Caenorhabditis bovis]|uniref:Uncharacterized protein n=1 Tax=Caenorhabditis bovis TaxID=2654633 RepID=A0A8S1EU76_9PELO|nr:unnamed protein product [Caenorhabditis bovis]